MNKYYDNIEECPLYVFKRCILKNDYTDLLISGTYDQDEAKEAWYNLFDAYNEAVKSKSVNVQFELQKQIQIKQGEYAIITNCLNAIYQFHQVDLQNELLESLGVEVEKPEFNLDQYIKTINWYGFGFDKKKGIIKELERVKKQIGVYKTEVESLQKKIDKIGEETGEWTFEDTVASVSKFMGFHLNKEITVSEFVSYLNSLIKSNKDGKSN